MAEERTLGQRIRDARAERGWSQARLASELKTTRQVVLRWEQDKHVPQARFMHLLAHTFNKPNSYFEAPNPLAELEDKITEIRDRRQLAV